MARATLKIDIWTSGRRKLPADLSDLAEAFAPHVERVKDLCEQGYQSGEIVDERFAGWWKIERAGNGAMHNTDTRCAFCDYVDALSKNDEISQELAQRVTL